ncbi:MAG: tandem-95 repeat protein, partial [Planctomycetes bacterium]|nr:tandem-95 repeat protein [Planctomycetota bacterium]
MNSRSIKARRLFHSANADPTPRRLSQTVRSLGLRRPLRIEPLEERRLLATGLSGIVFEDFNGDGVFGAAESPLSGWTVELDGTGLSTQTDGTGAYSFTDLTPATYDVRLDLLAGYRQTVPVGGGMHTVTLNTDDQAIDLDFGAQLNAPPTARNDEYTINRDTPFSINSAGGVLSNDADPNGDALAAIIGVIPAHGALTLAADGSFVYTPDQYYVGLDSFTYTANDGMADSEVATVALEIVQPGGNTRASDDFYSIELGGELDAGLINGNFELGDLTGWTIYTTAGGTLGGAGFPDIVGYDTNNDRVATESFQTMVGNGGGGIYQNIYLNAGEVMVTANVAVDSQVDHPEAGLFELLVDGTVVASYNFGSITADEPEHVSLGGRTTVAPGEHDIRVRITRSGASAFGSTPFGFVDNVSVYGATGSVLSNDPAAATASVAQLVTLPEHGSLDFEPDGSFRYVPDPDFSGVDTFDYKNVEPGYGMTLYTVDRFNDKLLKMDSVTGNLSVVGSIEHDMLGVDMTYHNGVLYALSSGSGIRELVTIDPATGRHIDVVPLNSQIDYAGLTALEDGRLATLIKTSQGQRLIELDPATGQTVTTLTSIEDGFNWGMQAVSLDAQGRVLGTWLYWEALRVFRLSIDPSGFSLLGGSYPPPQGTGDFGPALSDATLVGEDQFVLRATTQYLHRLNTYADGYDVTLDDVNLSPTGDTLSGLAYAPEFETNTATVTISVTVPPPTATDDTYTTDEDTTLVVDAAAGLLDNDTDPQNEPLEAVLLDPPQNGTLLLGADGSFTYVPDEDFYGPDTFTYVANNGSSDSTPATVTITVDPVNDIPVAVDDDFYSVIEFETLTVDVAGGVLANDTDIDNDPLEAILDVGPANGTLQLNPDGSFVYTPDSTGFLGFDTFTYLANDGTDDSNIATVSIEVIERTAPFAVDDGPYVVAEDDTLTVDVATGLLENDSDPQGNPITAVLDVGPQHGTLQLDPEGSFVYLPDSNYVGPDSFTYTSNDGLENSELATVTLEVTPVDDATIAVDDDYTIDEDTTLVVNVARGVLDNDEEVDGDPLEAILDVDVEHGTLQLAPNGSFSYRADEHYYGPDSFTYHVNDGLGDSNITTVDILITPVNDPPVAVPDSATVAEGGTIALLDSGQASVLANDTDADLPGDVLTAVLDADVAFGVLTLNGDGTFSYTHDGSENFAD